MLKQVMPDNNQNNKIETSLIVVDVVDKEYGLLKKFVYALNVAAAPK